MLPWFWVTWAVRSCCLNFKCSQPDSSSYCDGGGEGFQRPVSFYCTPSKGVTNQSICLLLKSLQEKRLLPYKFFLAALKPNLHPFGSSVPGCSSHCPQQGSAVGIPAGTWKGQCPVPSNATSLLPSLWAWSCLGRSPRVWSGKTFLHGVFNCHLIWV